MKKFFIITIMLLMLITKAKAYENEIFKIDIPESYVLEDSKEENNYRWIKDNNYISITTSDNSKLKYDVKEFTDEEINKQKEYIETGINKGLEKYNINITVNDIKKLNDDDIYYLEYDVYYPSKDITGYDMYQKGRMYTTNKYITTIIYSSDKEIAGNDEYLNIINSLDILDSNVIHSNLTLYIIITIASGILLFVIAVIIIKKRKHK